MALVNVSVGKSGARRREKRPAIPCIAARGEGLYCLDKRDGVCKIDDDGGVAERSKAAVLKTVVPQGTVGSNPTSSAFFHVILNSSLKVLWIVLKLN